MQSQFEYATSLVEGDATLQDPSPIINHLLQMAEPIKEPLALKPYAKKQRRHRPAEGFWRFILVGVDALLIIPLVGWVFFALPVFAYLEYQTPNNLLYTWQGKLLFLCLILVCWNFVARLTYAHNLSYSANRFKGPFSVFMALMLLAFLSLFVIDPLIGIDLSVSVQRLGIFLGIAAPTMIVWRALFALLLNLPRFRRRVVIVGSDDASEVLAEEIQRLKHSTITVLGYIQDAVSPQMQGEKFPMLGNKDSLRFLVQNQMVDMIIIAIDYRTNIELFQEAIDAAQFGVAVVPIAIVLESISGKIPVKYISDQWYATLPLELPVSPWYLLWEVVLNYIFGICGFVIMLVILPIITLLIYLESPGPVFYTQERLGFQGKPLRVYKFRSMRPDAENTGRGIWAIKNDPRTTKIGRFMRVTHLDELPQVINILRGEMSLIGPRPERAEFVSVLEKTIPFYRCRLATKPGLTGWAQVKYRYGNTENDALVKLQYDLYYIKHRSFMLDVFIIMKTVLEVLQRRGV